MLTPVFAVLFRSLTRRPEPGRSATPITESYLDAIREPRPSRLIRYSFGSLWILDAMLQAQPHMARGFVAHILRPVGTSGPSWLAEILSLAGAGWNSHPTTSDTFSIIIQLGIGGLLIFASTRREIRFAAHASALWALVIWVVGEGVGGLLNRGASWTTGSPGAAALYIVGSLLVASGTDLDAELTDGRPIRVAELSLGIFWLVETVLQALPFEGYWNNGLLLAMRSAYSNMPGPFKQPEYALIDLVKQHQSLANLVLIILMAVIGTGFLHRRTSIIATFLSLVLASLTWWSTMGFGVFGGYGTDPNVALPYMFLVGILLYARYSYRSRTDLAVIGVSSRERGLLAAIPVWIAFSLIGTTTVYSAATFVLTR